MRYLVIVAALLAVVSASAREPTAPQPTAEDRLAVIDNQWGACLQSSIQLVAKLREARERIQELEKAATKSPVPEPAAAQNPP